MMRYAVANTHYKIYKNYIFVVSLPKIAKKHLIIFTRYPQAGKTKTRLIPALGVEGAANLQRQMTEFTLDKVKKFQLEAAISFEIRFAGGDLTIDAKLVGNRIELPTSREW